MMQATCKEQLVCYSGACRAQLSPTAKLSACERDPV